jgi:hypothetical protein
VIVDYRVAEIREPWQQLSLSPMTSVTNYDVPNLRKASRRKIKGFQLGE